MTGIFFFKVTSDDDGSGTYIMVDSHGMSRSKWCYLNLWFVLILLIHGVEFFARQPFYLQITAPGLYFVHF